MCVSLVYVPCVVHVCRICTRLCTNRKHRLRLHSNESRDNAERPRWCTWDEPFIMLLQDCCGSRSGHPQLDRYLRDAQVIRSIVQVFENVALLILQSLSSVVQDLGTACASLPHWNNILYAHHWSSSSAYELPVGSYLRS